MNELFHTPFHKLHLRLGAQMVDFGGWEMPIQYPNGILSEHLITRKKAGVFDVSHMGRFLVTGDDSLRFLQYILTNNAASLEVGESHYTLIQSESGGALDDAYLYRFFEDSFLLVVNAANRQKDWHHFLEYSTNFPHLSLTDKTFDIAMLSLQGPESKDILHKFMTGGRLPDPARNALSTLFVNDISILTARTGYTGEPICFELFFDVKAAYLIWERLIKNGAAPIGLGARDTLRLEAGMPLYGHELGLDRDGKEIPLLASRLSKFALSFSSLKGAFLGKEKLQEQHNCLKKILEHEFSDIAALPQMIFTVAVLGKGIVRHGHEVLQGEKVIGYITSGTMVPYHKSIGKGMESVFLEETQKRAIGLALLDSHIQVGDHLQIKVRKKRINCVVVPYHICSEAPPYVRPIPPELLRISSQDSDNNNTISNVSTLLRKSINNTKWRQQECINLIPSEQSQSTLTRLLSITDACGRYAEHKEMRAFSHADIFYYQGIEFIQEVERLLNKELRAFFQSEHMESRLISGQMANTAVFSGMVDFINRSDRRSEPMRLRKVLNNHIIRGGHLSAQPMGALRDFVARDPKTEKPAVINFPVHEENPFKIDTLACRQIFEDHRPDLVILGKSMTLHKEPVTAMRALIEELSPNTILMYDMAHVLGLYGNHFQSPLIEGADLITGSTHKTFFGTQRGIVASNIREEDTQYPLWEAVQRRTFPGSVSNHHLGTLLGLLMATYEMNHFKDDYQKNIIRNAKAFAQALSDTGLAVAGDPDISYTETHQVIINVGYAKGYEIARRLEKNNIIVNYQATPAEEGFTAAGSLRTGVSEMTRFGMGVEDFQEVAQMFHDVIIKNKDIRNRVSSFRSKFNTMRYCFEEGDFSDLIEELHNIL